MINANYKSLRQTMFKLLLILHYQFLYLEISIKEANYFTILLLKLLNN